MKRVVLVAYIAVMAGVAAVGIAGVALGLHHWQSRPAKTVAEQRMDLDALVLEARILYAEVVGWERAKECAIEVTPCPIERWRPAPPVEYLERARAIIEARRR